MGTTAKQVGQGSGLAERQLRLHGGLGWMRTALASALQPFRSCMAPAPLPAAAEASPLPQQMGLASAGAVEPSADRPQTNAMVLNLAAGASPQPVRSTFVPHQIWRKLVGPENLHHFAALDRSLSQEEQRLKDSGAASQGIDGKWGASSSSVSGPVQPLPVASSDAGSGIGLSRSGQGATIPNSADAVNLFRKREKTLQRDVAALVQRHDSLQKSMADMAVAVKGLGLQLALNSQSQKPVEISPDSRRIMKNVNNERKLVFAAYMAHYSEVAKLLENGVNVNANVELGTEVWEEDSDWMQAVAADTRDPELGGFDVDSDPPHGSFTPLLASLEISNDFSNDRGKVALLLLRCGASDKVVDNESQASPLILAAKMGFLKVVDQLLLRSKSSVNAVDCHNKTALLWACCGTVDNDSEACIKALLAAGAAVTVNTAIFSRNRSVHSTGSDGMTALHFLCQKRRTSLVRLLLSSCAAVNKVSAKGETPLIAACGERWGTASCGYNSVFGISATTLEERITLPSETVAVLLRAGANVHAATTTDKVTALHKACEYADMASCKMLVARGADPHVRNNEGKTPLDVYGSKQSFMNPMDTHRYINPAHPPPPKEPVLSDADRKIQVAQLVEARRLHLAIPLLKALFSARILERGAGAGIGTGTGTVSGMGPVAVAVAVAAGGDEARREAKAGAKAPPKAPKALSRVLGNDDLIALITAWL